MPWKKKRPVVRIGTSGYSYSWNEGKPTPFAWYLGQGFNTVEINASFYRFPSQSWINAWRITPRDFDFSIKVHRSITHFSRLGERSLETFGNFKSKLKEIEAKISFWLFQMPESFRANEENLIRVREFFKSAELGEKAALEFRHNSWWKHVKEIEELGAVFCSVDAPYLPRDIISANNSVYLRLHGRERWYSSVYTGQQLEEIANEIHKAKADRKYIFLNNDHGMIPNSRLLKEKLD